ncbi:DUF4111 domain-containing protein [Rossellomorea aquimaris]|uniref:aminoglycoside adenylyltransferase domain-containing protein n=1 Tax=Rossellomorea aquimaris TaxID=189382 RepID=UPI001CD377F1|nr:aminoglycoside adenylyltransferase domain-containing protein [Rossellomorea aquimaris]MCA1054379.1 DUF4111 domain-containing protein [Rossellomorea aquimaris]
MKEFPEEVKESIDSYLSLLEEYLPNTVSGLWIHGSIALDAYVKDSSDIDFITITSRELTMEDSNVLASIHQELQSQKNKPEWDGVYITLDELKNVNENVDAYTCKSYLFFNDGEMHHDSYFNFNPITWFTLAHKGIAGIGPDPRQVELDDHSDQLVDYVQKNMNSYWKNRVEHYKEMLPHIQNIPTEKIETEIEWTVLGLLRQYYTIKEENIISKLHSGYYGLKHLPVKWHPLIQESINIRSNHGQSLFPSDEERVETLYRFAQFIFTESLTDAPSKST